MNGYHILGALGDPKLIEASLRAMPGEEPTLDGKTQGQIWQTTPVSTPSLTAKMNTKEAKLAQGYGILVGGLVGLVLGGVGGALLWPAHRVIGGLLVGWLGGSAGAGVGHLIASYRVGYKEGLKS